MGDRKIIDSVHTSYLQTLIGNKYLKVNSVVVIAYCVFEFVKFVGCFHQEDIEGNKGWDK